MRTVVVRYQVRPEAAEENGALIRDVFAQLERENVKGLRYQSLRLADGVSFVHIASHDGDDTNPLTELTAFREFVSGIRARCVEGPLNVEAAVMGLYAG